MKVTILHFPDSIRRDMAATVSSEEVVNLATEHLSDYDEIAVLDLYDDRVDHILNSTYRITQNDGSNWICVADSFESNIVYKDNARSSSVGDIFMVDGVNYVVVSHGFERIV